MTFQEFLKLVGAILTALGGGSVILFAFSSWLGKVWAGRILNRYAVELEGLKSELRRKVDTELEKTKSDFRHSVDADLQRLKDQLERGQFIHRMQFETEFKAYVELWDKLIDFQNAALAVHPTFESVATGKTNEQVMHESVLELVRTYEQFKAIHSKHKPFLASRVYFACFDLFQAVYDAGFADMPAVERVEHLRNARGNTDRIIENGEKISEAIRERIGIVGAQEPTPTPATAQRS